MMTDKENNHSNILMEDDDLEDEEESQPVVKLQDRRLLQAKNRRRRRSSARFLKLDVGEDDEDDVPAMSTANLGEVYQNAIRLNAENKINASNSWNLNLIDHLDRFVSTNTSTNKPFATAPTTASAVSNLNLEEPNHTNGVNFTKASCTLDASVKIYSYRVDDVHLTSYKVLANLNRTENNKQQKKKNNEEPASGNTTRMERRKTTETETIEQNLANINVAKLDEAFDIDPLFHKMSKTFDEGGAKGLLLANLGVSLNGCNIVFDSTLEDDEEEQKEEEDFTSTTEEEAMDVTSLVNKLESILNGQPIHLLPFVPQLATLRDEYAQLHQEGFVDKNAPTTKRYAAPQEDEIEADRSIHLEAIERSRASQAELGRSLLMAQEGDGSTFDNDDDGPIDFGAGNDFGGDDNDDDRDIPNFIHDGDHRFSSSSFQSTFEASQPPSQASMLLDAIANGNISGSQSNYELFNQKALDKLQGSNQWAGAAHWKRTQASTTRNKTVTTKKGGKKKKTTKKVSLLNLRDPVDNLEDLLRKPPAGRKGVDPLQLSKAMVSKYSKNDNLLPLDLGLTVDDLSKLFLRPKTKLSSEGSNGESTQDNASGKQVGFSGVDTWNDNDSYGGAGFDFGGGDEDQDSIVLQLEGVRKVDKVKVGYATVAKKVDVKRLKFDLWEELERTLSEQKKSTEKEEMIDSFTDDQNVESLVEEQPPAKPCPLSFQDTVKEMQGTQKQSDVTLPFYFICVLHLANEKGLALESTGLEDFIIHTS